MKNNHKFFCNNECKYFPCHKTPDEKNLKNFNCLFCYCPLYFLGGKCGGNFKYVSDGRVKNCANCHLPHMPEYYSVIISKLKDAAKSKIKTAKKDGDDI